MVLIGVAGLPGSGKQELINFLHSAHKLKVYTFKPPPILRALVHADEDSKEEEKNEIKEKKLVKITSNESEREETPLSKVSEIWNEDIVIGPLYCLETIKTLQRKAYFHLIFIETPVLTRFANFRKKYDSKIDIQTFLLLEAKISKELSLETIRKMAKYEISNTGNLEDFRKNIETNIKYVIRPIKPTWEQYFMNIAFSVRTRSNCMRKNAGAILVRNNRILSTGYTGTPQGLANCNEGGCECCNKNKEDLVCCLCIHAEENTILEVGIAGSERAICYSTQFPCIWCMKVLVQGKIRKLVYHREDDDREEPLALEILKENGIEYVRYEKDLNVF